MAALKPSAPKPPVVETKKLEANGATPTTAPIAPIEKSKKEEVATVAPVVVKVKRAVTEEELIEILDSLPPGMLERVLVKRFSDSH